MRKRIVYHGYVQGVGFRYTTAQIANDLPVNGYVKNLPDGTVELVVEAAENVIVRLILAIERQFDGSIKNRMESDLTSDEEFQSFEIR